MYLFVCTSYILLLLSSCTKKDPVNPNVDGPDGFLITDGFLSTIGKYYSGASDTLTYVRRGGGANDLSEYGFQYRAIYSGVSFENNSNGTVSIKLKIPYVNQNRSHYYFSIAPTNPGISNQFPNNAYQFDNLKAEKSNDTEFIVKRIDADRRYFTIESKKYPGYYLDIARWVYGGTNGDQWMVFTTNKKQWFFVAD